MLTTNHVGTLLILPLRAGAPARMVLGNSNHKQQKICRNAAESIQPPAPKSLYSPYFAATHLASNSIFRGVGRRWSISRLLGPWITGLTEVIQELSNASPTMATPSEPTVIQSSKVDLASPSYLDGKGRCYCILYCAYSAPLE